MFTNIVFIILLFAGFFIEKNLADEEYCGGHPTNQLYHSGDIRYLNNPKNASEFCLLINENKYHCPSGYTLGPKFQQVSHMRCVPQANAQEMRDLVDEGKYMPTQDDWRNPICIRAPKECICENKTSSSLLENYKLKGSSDDENIDYDTQIFFVLLTSANNYKPQKIFPTQLENFLSPKFGFDKEAETKIICHGFLASSDLTKDGPAKILSEAYIQRSKRTKKPVNIILVDWAALSGNKKYPNWWDKATIIFNLAKAYALPRFIHFFVGWYTATMMEYLVVCGGASPDSIHALGHSLGGHAMGYAGKLFNSRQIGKISRLTVLDGAGPCFDNFKMVECFENEVMYTPASPTDAQFVDAIHTHGEVLGMKKPVGQVDFYVNGGLCQPGCWSLFTCPACSLCTCSHSRSYHLMAESINAPHDNFQATKCKSVKEAMTEKCNSDETANMGEYADRRTRGVFYVKTRGKSPFGLGHKKYT